MGLDMMTERFREIRHMRQWAERDKQLERFFPNLKSKSRAGTTYRRWPAENERVECTPVHT